jgi:hypothetical protein
MGTRVVSVLGAIVLAAGSAVSAQASDAQAPPMLTPLVAQRVAAVCPGTAAYAEALVRGISDAQAAVAAPLFDKCAAFWRHDHDDSSRNAASTAVGAVYLSRGLLNHDPAFLRRAIDATDEVRRYSHLSEDLVRRWPIIPDFFDDSRREAVVSLDCEFSLGPDATYIYLAARTGTAWITQPREPVACRRAGRPTGYVTGGPTSTMGNFSPSGSTRPDPAIEPSLNSPVRPGP